MYGRSVEALWQHKHSFWVRISDFWDIPTVHNWKHREQTKSFVSHICFPYLLWHTTILKGLTIKGLSENFLKPREQGIKTMELLKISWPGQKWLTGDLGHKWWQGMARNGYMWCDARRVTTAWHDVTKSETLKDLLYCGFHNLEIIMTHVVTYSNRLKEACTIVFLRDMLLEDWKIEYFY